MLSAGNAPGAANHRDFAGELLARRRRGVGCHGEQPIDRGAGNFTGRGPLPDQPAAQRRSGQQRGEILKQLGREDGIQRWRGEVCPIDQRAAGAAESKQRLDTGLMIAEPLADPISRVSGRLVARILAPLTVVTAKKLDQGAAANLQERTNNQDSRDALPKFHSTQPQHTGPAQQPQCNGLGLIVGMMGEQDAIEAVLGNRAGEEGQSKRAIMRGWI